MQSGKRNTYTYELFHNDLHLPLIFAFVFEDKRISRSHGDNERSVIPARQFLVQAPCFTEAQWSRLWCLWCHSSLMAGSDWLSGHNTGLPLVRILTQARTGLLCSDYRDSDGMVCQCPLSPRWDSTLDTNRKTTRRYDRYDQTWRLGTRKNMLSVFM